MERLDLRSIRIFVRSDFATRWQDYVLVVNDCKSYFLYFCVVGSQAGIGVSKVPESSRCAVAVGSDKWMFLCTFVVDVYFGSVLHKPQEVNLFSL